MSIMCSGPTERSRLGASGTFTQLFSSSCSLSSCTGRLPQNVNFAISGATARAFLDAHKIRYRVSTSTAALLPVDIAARARGFTVSVECTK